MIISHFGLGMVKVALGDRVVVFNPIGKNASLPAPLKPLRFGADLVLVSVNDQSCNGTDQMSYGERQPVVIDGPGEYEAGGIAVRGLAANGPPGPLRGEAGRLNTVYLLVWDDIRLVHLGAPQEPLPAAAKEELAPVDVLFAPVNYAGAVAAVALLEPRLVVPLGLTEKQSLEHFLRELGAEAVKPEPALQLKKKDLAGKEAAVAVVKSF